MSTKGRASMHQMAVIREGDLRQCDAVLTDSNDCIDIGFTVDDSLVIIGLHDISDAEELHDRLGAAIREWREVEDKAET